MAALRRLAPVALVALALGAAAGGSGLLAADAPTKAPAAAPAVVPAAAPSVAPAAAWDLALHDPHAEGGFGEDLVFSTTISASLAPERVEMLARLPHDLGVTVTPARLEQTGPGSWRATVTQRGHVMPNTLLRYRFRATDAQGRSVDGREAVHRVRDGRFAWQSLSGPHVTVWWYEGDDAFAREALDIAEGAIAEAATLLGVEAVERLDFFIYSDDRDFRQALGPATRENVGGEAHPDIRTLYGLIEPRQVGSDWVRELVVHELAHLVFDAATRNPYGFPPRWLNEGLAVRLSRPDDSGDRAQVAAAVRLGTLMPLEGLAGQFPTRADRFGLAYAESADAVGFLVRTYGEEGLVRLVRAFGEGGSVEEAFTAATGSGFSAFEDAWLASLGASRPVPFGPQPGLPGPLPDAWAGPPAALLR